MNLKSFQGHIWFVSGDRRHFWYYCLNKVRNPNGIFVFAPNWVTYLSLECQILGTTSRVHMFHVKEHKIKNEVYLKNTKLQPIDTLITVRQLRFLSRVADMDESRLTRQVMSSQGTLVIGKRAGRHKTTKQAYRCLKKSRFVYKRKWYQNERLDRMPNRWKTPDTFQDWVADPLISFDCEALKGPLAVELLPAKVGIRTLLVGNLKRSYCRLRDLMG